MKFKKMFALLLSIAMLSGLIGSAFANEAEETYESVVAEINAEYGLGFEFYSNGGMSVSEFKSWLTEVAIENACEREAVVINVAAGGPGIMPLVEWEGYRGEDGPVEIVCNIACAANADIIEVTDIAGYAVRGANHNNKFEMSSSGYTIASSLKSVNVWVYGTLKYISKDGVSLGSVQKTYSCTFRTV